MGKGPTKKMKYSILTMLIIIVGIGYSIVIGRLFYLQLIDNEKYQQLAIEQQLRDTSIPAQRGTIYDANRKVLAQSATVWTVYIAPAEINSDKDSEKAEKNRVLIAEGLSRILGVERELIIEKSKKKNYYESIKRKVEKPQVDEIRQYITEHNLPGVHITEDSKRYYTYGDFAASILGFTGDDGQGLAGIESYYDKFLKGTPGRIVTAANALGTDLPFEYEKLYDPINGNDVVLTIDETLQHYLEKHLSFAVKEHNVTNKGAGLIMNVKTGEILAMATKPDFDPNNPFEIADEAAKLRLAGLEGDGLKKARGEEQSKQWRNKLVSDLYEPGSVFKTVTASAGLEERAVTLTSPFNCTGSLVVAGVTIRCNETKGHGAQTFSDSLKNSCNPIFMQVGEKLGKDNFFKYLEGFGLTEKTGIDLPGEEQSVYYKPGNTGPVELASQSFGQSNKITPIQMATAVAAVVNDGKLMQPHMVKKIVDKDGNTVKNIAPTMKRQVVSEETSNIVVQMMERVVNEGISSKNAYVKGYKVAGKSGTSQKLDGAEDARIASFAAVAPAEDPEILVLIVLDEPHSYSQYGSVLSAPVAGNVLAETLPYLGIAPNYTEDELKNLAVSVPSMIGKSFSAASEKIRQQGLKVQKVGDGDTVISQFPTGGQKVSLNSTVIVYTSEGEEKTEVPNVMGMTMDVAAKTLTNKGLNVQLEGNFKPTDKVYVSKQSHGAGESVPLGTVVKLEFINRESEN